MQSYQEIETRVVLGAMGGCCCCPPTDVQVLCKNKALTLTPRQRKIARKKLSYLHRLQLQYFVEEKAVNSYFTEISDASKIDKFRHVFLGQFTSGSIDPSFFRLSTMMTPQSGELGEKDRHRLSYQNKMKQEEKYKNIKNKTKIIKNIKTEKEINNKFTEFPPKDLKRMHKDRTIARSYIRSHREAKQITPHSLATDFGGRVIKTALKEQGFDTDIPIKSLIENTVAMIVGISRCNDNIAIASLLFVYFKSMYTESVCDFALTYARELLLGKDDNDISPHSETTLPTWLTDLKATCSNWTLMVRNEGCRKLLAVLSMVVALGMCRGTDLVPTIGGLKMFTLPIINAPVTMTNFFDAIFEAIVYFVEGGWTCFKTGSFAPLLYGNHDAEAFAKNYKKCHQCSILAPPGNLASIGMDDNDYAKLLADTGKMCMDLQRSSSNGMEISVLKRQGDTITKWETEFMEKRVTGKMRMSPYTIGIYGGSGVGKSTLTHMFMRHTLRCNNFEFDSHRICVLNEKEKFWSTYRSYMNGVILDDLGNTTPQFVQIAPTDLIIQLCNNIPFSAPMAASNMKGSVSVEPRCVVITRNVKDANAAVYSCEPASIARREHCIITATVRSEYANETMLDTEKVRKVHGKVPNFPDYWKLTVERAVPSPRSGGGPAGIKYITESYKGRELKDVGVAVVMDFIRERSQQHFTDQAKLVSGMTEEDELCKSCFLPDAYCDCPTPTLEPHSIAKLKTPKSLTTIVARYLNPITYLPLAMGNYFLKLSDKFLSKALGNYAPIFFNFLTRLEKASTDVLWERIGQLDSSPWIQWTNWIPDSVRNSTTYGPICDDVISHVEKNKILRRSLRSQLIASGVLGFSVLSAFWFAGRYIWKKDIVDIAKVAVSSLGISMSCGVIQDSFHHERQMLVEEIHERADAAPVLQRKVRNSNIALIVGACIFIKALYEMAKMYRAMYKLVSPQSSLDPTDTLDVKKRDASINQWLEVSREKPRASRQSKSITRDDLNTLVGNNTGVIFTEIRGIRKFSNIFFPCSNIALIPEHFWEGQKTMKVSIERNNMVGGKFTALLQRDTSINIPNSDLCLTYVPSGGDWKDLSKYFPIERPRNCPARISARTKEHDIKSCLVRLESQRVSVRGIPDYEGFMYSVDFPTFDGMCMAPLVSESIYPQIVGFHLGGKTGQQLGVAGFLTQNALGIAMAKLDRLPGVLLSHNRTEVDDKLFGKQILLDEDVHEKSATRFLKKASCRLIAPIVGRHSMKSQVHDSPISENVSKIMHSEQRWGPPKLDVGYPFQASLEYAADPADGVPSILLSKAVNCYSERLGKIFYRFPQMLEYGPLDNIDIVSGIDGMRFIDAMKANTSCGFGLGGPKKKYLIDLENLDSHMSPRTFPRWIWDKLKIAEENLLRGERANFIFSANLKDEPTLHTKETVRVFQAAPLILQLAMRKYFLPLLRVLSLFPLVSECAVGINAESPEWQELDNYITYHGNDRIFAGDYSKYDLRMPAQLTLASFKIMIEMASQMNYTHDDLKIMRGIATEVCYPLTAYNGDLLEFLGTNPSGHNCTVYTNSIVNSLLIRCGYFDLYPDGDFDKEVNIITYGDDVKGSVKSSANKFTHISYADFLDRYRMVFTMPNKSDTPTPYMNNEECDFLKRKTFYNPDLGYKIGILDDSSIFRSLHSQMKSDEMTPEEIAAQNICGAANSWFFHGREIYDKRTTQLRAVAEASNLTHLTTALDVPYDAKVDKWRKTYVQVAEL